MASKIESGSEKVITILNIAASSIWFLLLAMIPQCIYAKKEYVEECEEVWNRRLMAPSKLIWIVGFMVAIMTASEIAADFGTIVGSVGIIFVMIFTLFYFLILGIVFGSLTTTLSASCKLLGANERCLVVVSTEESMLKQANYLLQRYQALKAVHSDCLLSRHPAQC